MWEQCISELMERVNQDLLKLLLLESESWTGGINIIDLEYESRGVLDVHVTCYHARVFL